MKSKIENPLTVVAIFASLAEVASTAVLAALPLDIQKYFVWFVILFPVLLVVLFFLTWNFNNKVLYPPNQYTDEKHFVALNQGKIYSEDLYDKLNSLLSVDKSTDIKEAIKDVLSDLDVNLKQTEESIKQDIVLKTNNSKLKIIINGTVIGGDSVKDFYANIIKHILSIGVDLNSNLPYATGPKRYLISSTNYHKNGEEFTSPIEVEGKYFLETHKSKVGAVNDIARFLESIGLEVKKIS